MYEQIARYYDLTHNDLTVDLPMIFQLAEKADGEILELGCGTGRLLLPLIKGGFTVTGLDNSRAMLAQATAKLLRLPEDVRARVTLVEGDMTNLDLDGRFALVIIPYNTLLHLNQKQVAKTLAGVREVLSEDGRLFIDLPNPFTLAQTPNDRMLTLERIFTDPTTSNTVAQMASNHLDDEAQKLRITWIYDATDAEGITRRTITYFDYHYLFAHQMELLINQAKLRLYSLTGNYNGSSFTEESERMLLLIGKSSLK